MYKVLFLLLSTIPLTAQDVRTNYIYTNGASFDFDKEVKILKNRSHGTIHYLDLVGQSISNQDTTLIFEKQTKSKPYAREDIKENNYDLRKDLGQNINDFLDIEIPDGKSVFINFSFSRCPPCRREIPHIDKLYAKHKGEFEFLVITPDKDYAELKSLFSSDIQFLHLEDTDIFWRFGVKSYPKTIIFNKKGEMQFVLNEIKADFIGSYLYSIVFD